MSQKGIIINTTATGHVDAGDFAAILYGILGTDCVINYGDNLACTKLSENSVRVKSGLALTKHTIVRVSDYADLTIESGTLGVNRKGYIIVDYEQDGNGESDDIAQLSVIYGTETSGTAAYPTLTQTDAKYQVVLIGFSITDTTLTLDSALSLPVVKGLYKTLHFVSAD